MDLGLDREDPSAALEALTDSLELRVDLAYAGERAFVSNVSFGAYAALVQDPAYREDKSGTILRILPEFLVLHESPELVVRAGSLSVDRPDAVLVSNNHHQVDDPAGLHRHAHPDSGSWEYWPPGRRRPPKRRPGREAADARTDPSGDT